MSDAEELALAKEIVYEIAKGQVLLSQELARARYSLDSTARLATDLTSECKALREELAKAYAALEVERNVSRALGKEFDRVATHLAASAEIQR